MHPKLPTLPEELRSIIRRFYSNPIKVDKNQEHHDLRKTSLTESETVVLAQLAYQTSPAGSLEIGLALAASCISIAAVRKHLELANEHVALDPFQETLSGSVGLLEIEREGLKKYVRWVPERSEDYLPGARARGETYDFVFIDGGHGIGQVVADAFLSDRVLNAGGVIVFHDGLLFSTLAAIKYLVQECEYVPINLPSDSTIKSMLRRGKYLVKLGPWYAAHVVPKMHGSLVALRKPLSN